MRTQDVRFYTYVGETRVKGSLRDGSSGSLCLSGRVSFSGSGSGHQGLGLEIGPVLSHGLDDRVLHSLGLRKHVNIKRYVQMDAEQYLVVDRCADVCGDERRRLRDGADHGNGHQVSLGIRLGRGLDICHIGSNSGSLSELERLGLMDRLNISNHKCEQLADQHLRCR